MQNTSNVITWTYSPGDPSPVDIVVTNPDNTTLNGNFSIARFIDISAEVSSFDGVNWTSLTVILDSPPQSHTLRSRLVVATGSHS